MSTSSDQTQTMEGVLPQSIQYIEQRMRKTFANRSLSEGNAVPNVIRNGDDDDDDDDESENEINIPNKPLPLPISSSEPIYRTYKGNLTKFDNSVHETNIMSKNAEYNEIRHSFNYNYSVGPSRKGLCGFFFFCFWCTRKLTLLFSNLLGKEGASQQQVVSARRKTPEEEE